MINQTQIKNIDWILIALLLINTLIGIAVIYSSSQHLPGNYYLRQAFWMLLSLAVLFLLLTVDYTILVTYSLYFYIACVSILGAILIFGRLIAGTKSWIKLEFVQFQPSEITKIALILLLARIFSEYKKKYLSNDAGISSSAFVFMAVVLVALQPDLGTALSYIPILLAAFILAGLTQRTLVTLLIIAIVIGAVSWGFFLKDYQKDRITTLLTPEKDPLGTGYHILQSKIAIGSGGLFGKGFGRGTQSQLQFLPARHTDFIFAVVGEELGFAGVVIIGLFYFLFLARLFHSVSKSRDRTGVFIIFMVAMMISSLFFVNVFMTIGLFPIAGIPLPFLSYGGSSLLTNYIAVSLVLNVKMRRFVNV